jgi:DMSO reductase anchor subunit
VGAPAPRKTSLVTEAPLVVFSLLAALLAGVMATPAGRALVGLPAFLVLAALAAGASTLHLGRKGRAWRALLNVRHSWLSREVTLFALFVTASLVVLSPLPAPPWAAWAAAVLGFALLFAVDRVYSVTRTPGLPVHSAGVLLTGVMVAGVVDGSAVVWGAVLTAKIISYTARKARFYEEGQPLRRAWVVVRMAAGAAASGLLIVALPQGATEWGAVAWLAVGLLTLGETVDRCEFYLELEVSTPRAAMGRALAERLGRPEAVARAVG